MIMYVMEMITLTIRDQLNAEAEAVQIILTEIDNDIYSIVDACPNACEMWKAIERLKQDESINVQDLETNLYWEFGKFTSRDVESLESYYSRFYKMMNELVRNQCDSQELKTVFYHKLYDILKQHQNEVNEIRAERLARTANPLALVAQQQPVYHPQNHPTYYTQNSSTRSQKAATRNKGKAIVNSPPPIYDQEPQMVAEDDEISKDEEIDKLIALISLSFKKIYKPTNNNLRTSPNTSRANQDNSLRINRGTRYYNQRIVSVDVARENVGTPVVQKYRIQCYNCKEYGHVARECQKPKRAKDAAYHKEKMLLYQELEAHYMYMAQIQEVIPDVADNSGPIFDTEPLQKLVDIILFIVDSGCSKHMTRNLKLLINFVEKFLGTVKFGNDQIAPILGYGDLVQGTVTIKRVYYVEGLNHNLFSIGLFCDTDLEVAFRKSTCYIRDLKRNDLLTGSRGTDLYSITLQDTSTPNPICLMAKVTSSQAWLWNRRLSHLNFNTINLLSKNDIVIGLPKLKFTKDHLCSSSELGKAKQKSFQTKTTPSSKRRLQLLHMDLCGPMQMASDHISSDPVPQCPIMALEHDSLSLGPQSQENVPRAAGIVTTSNELDFLFSSIFNELLNVSTQVVSKSSAVTTANAPNKFKDDEFINIFCTPVQDRGETSSRHVDLSNMHTFYQRHPSEHRWTKYHPLEQVIGNPSQSVRTRRQLESDGEMCMFALTVSRTEPKNIKEAMANYAWIESMQEEHHQFD
nr:integrase, catalytic region, zinc finger, CCHC-type, peptidase aspartic, catalytic [Tanacetum cinerariifolium]